MATSPVTLEVSESYSQHLGLRPGHDDLEVSITEAERASTQELERELKRLAAEHGLSIEQTTSEVSRTQQSGVRHFDGGITTFIQEAHRFLVNGGADAMKDFLVVAAPVVTTWLQLRGSRSAVLKQGDKEATLKGMSAKDGAKLIREFETDGRPARRSTTRSRQRRTATSTTSRNQKRPRRSRGGSHAN
jgi:hypothetical protein